MITFSNIIAVDPELIEYGNTHIRLLDAMKKEYKVCLEAQRIALW